MRIDNFHKLFRIAKRQHLHRHSLDKWHVGERRHPDLPRQVDLEGGLETRLVEAGEGAAGIRRRELRWGQVPVNKDWLSINVQTLWIQL